MWLLNNATLGITPKELFNSYQNYMFVPLDRQATWFPVYKKKYFIFNTYIPSKNTIHRKTIREPNQGLRPTVGERTSGGE